VTDSCLFCRCDLDSAPNLRTVEHIVARVFVGRDWLLSGQICKPCNSDFGSAVDSVGASSIYVPFREEVGLNVARADELSGTVVLPDGERVPVWMGRNGTSRAKRRVVRSADGRPMRVYGGDRAEAVEIAEGLSSKGKRRRGESIAWSEPEIIEDEGPTLVAPESKQLDEFERLMPRVVAKVAIEYIGLRYGADIALLPALDALRQFARYGTGERPRGFLGLAHGDHRLLYFPRTNQLHAFRQTPGEAVSDEQQLQLAVDEAGQPLPPPPDALPLRDIQHWLQVWKDADGLHFSWLLFSCFWFQLWLPPELPIYRFSADVWDFATGTQRSARW
jgi:hypothetical protein